MRPLIHLLLVLSLAVQGVASAAMLHGLGGTAPVAEVPDGADAMAGMPCHHDAVSAPASSGTGIADCCAHGHCDFLCGALALAPAIPAFDPRTPDGLHADPRVGLEHPAHRESRPRPPDSALA